MYSKELLKPMTTASKLSRILLVSPWFLLAFLIVPAAVILTITFHLNLPFANPALLLVNNICFACLAACRLLRYLSGLLRPIRYGAAPRPRLGVVESDRSLAAVRGELTASGYLFTADGSYGEKRDSGYLGATLFYAGLFILLAVGSWDNLSKFSGLLLDGMGPATDLNSLKSYRSFTKGPLAGTPDSLPRMRIIRQYLPDSSYPRGATEISLNSGDGKEQRHLLLPREPVRYGDYELYMAKLVFEPELVIKERESSRVLYDNFILLDPLVQKRGLFSFYGPYVGNDLVGGLYYQPEQSLLMVVITRNGKRVVTDLQFQVDQQVVQGEYLITCAKMGQWSEIHVVRRRHKGLLWFGGLLAIAGLAMRLALRSKRVWLEEAPRGCRLWMAGSGAARFMK